MIKNLFQEKEVKYFAIVSIIIGIMMTFLISPWQVPDEATHLQLISYSIHNPEFAQKITKSLGMDQGRVEWNETESTDMSQFLSALTKKPDYTISEMLPKGISLPAIKYLPAIVGMELAIILQLPTLWVLQFGEIAALLIYVFICAAALKFCPFKKMILAVFMISPMMMQGAGSLSYDSLAVAAMFWIISYVLYLTYEKKQIELKDIVLLVVPWLLTTYIKLPNVFIVFMGLMLPLCKFHVRLGKIEVNEQFIKKYRWAALGILFVGLAIVLFVLRNNRWIQILYGVFTEPKRILYLLYSTIQNFAGYLLISSVGNFGWLKAPVSVLFAVLFYLVIFILAATGKDASKKRMRKWDRGVMLTTLLLLTLMTIFAMINHTIMITLFGSESSPEGYNIREALYWIPYIGGLQGRYFVPFLSLFFLQIGSIEMISEKNTKILTGVFVGVTYVYVTYVLLNRFWIG